MSRIILTTIGSLGDLHPFIAIGRALAARGEQVLLAVPEDGVAKVRAAGLEAAPILPSYVRLCQRLRLTPEEFVARSVADTRFVIDEVLMPSLHDSSAALNALVDIGDILAGSLFAFATEIVAEKRGVPLATMVLQPMTLFSAWRPPVAPHFEWMRHHPQGPIGRGWNRACYSLVRAGLRRRYGKAVDAVRADYGLGSRRGALLIDQGPVTEAILCCWSAALGTLPPDAPRNAALVGLPFFDSESGAEEAPAPELEAFLRDGDAPLVFTLGSFVVASAGQFYQEAAAISRRLGRRAILLTGQVGPPRREGDCLILNYAPHSALFPHAAAIIHHGGIGTTGQALRAGRVQLVVPHFGDQFDNADRVQSAGGGLTIRREHFGGDIGTEMIDRILSWPQMAAAADRMARIVAEEKGAETAARHLLGLRQGRKPRSVHRLAS